MTVNLTDQDAARLIAARFPEAVAEVSGQAVFIRSASLSKVADYLKNSTELAFHLLNDITSVDYYDHFEVTYRVTSLKNNQTLVFKVRCQDRVQPEIPSVISIWKGADFMEREIFDLMGISFSGHPNLKRIFLWEGFKGHPLRKDFI